MIREAKFEDIYAITAMWKKLRIETGMIKRKDNSGFFVLELLNRLRNPNSIVIVCCECEAEEKIPIAFATGSVQNEIYSDSKKVFYCDDFYIEPEHRGKGIWEEMIDMGVNKAKQYGCEEMGVKVAYGLEKVYERKGFIPEQVLLRRPIGEDNGR